MAEQVTASECGHFTARNPDGSTPFYCDYCLLAGARRVEEGVRNGTLRVSPEILRAMREALETLKQARGLRPKRSGEKEADGSRGSDEGGGP